MTRWTRLAVAAMLIVAIPTLPIVLDHCHDTCAAHAAAALAPPCHHAQSPGSRLGRAPANCGHDHTASIGAPSSVATMLERAAGSVAVLVASTVPADRQTGDLISPHASPGSASRIHIGSLPLRV